MADGSAARADEPRASRKRVDPGTSSVAVAVASAGEAAEAGEATENGAVAGGESGKVVRGCAPRRSREEKAWLARQDAATRRLVEERERCLPQAPEPPLRFRVLLTGHAADVRARLLRRVDELAHMDDGTSEFGKLHACLTAACELPTARAPLALGPAQLAAELPRRLDAAVHGHGAAKRALVRAVARWMAAELPLRHPRGLVLALAGPPGVGKTSLAQAVGAALGLPTATIPLGGACDASYLDGNAPVYEGARHGAVAAALMRCGCTNPVLVFDELDKLGERAGGRDVQAALLHLTDAAQNAAFVDKYLADAPLDLSGALMIFTLNDASRVGRALLDRMTLVRVGAYDRAERLEIARKHLLPAAFRACGAEPRAVAPEPGLLDAALRLAGPEDGVRGLARLLNTAAEVANLARLRGGAFPLPPLRLDAALLEEAARELAAGAEPARAGPEGMYA